MSEMSEISVALIAGVVSAVVGSLVAYLASVLLQKKELKQARLHQRLDAVETVLEDIESDAAEYWTRTGQLPDLEKRLKKQLEKLEKKCSNLAVELGMSGIFNSETDLLHEIITGDRIKARIKELHRKAHALCE
jgi:uncharacterized membrane-anchored protein YhcB (DUF1043 family)